MFRAALTISLASCAVCAISAAGAEDGARLGRWSESVAESWWRANPSPDQWRDEALRMTVTLRVAHERHGLRKMIANNHWMGWMLHTRWLRLMPENWESDDFYQFAENRAVFVQISQSQRIREQFLGALVPDDDEIAAARILCQIAAKHPRDFAKFSALAVAFAVVFDQPVPKTWPHAFVDSAKLAAGDSDPVDRFAFLVECQKQGRLLHDLSRLGVRDLTFVVDTPLEHKELRYAQQIKLNTPDKLTQLFPAVRYDNERIRSQRYLWPGASYRLIDIGRNGGICMDQAFFVSQTGKAKGVPTLLFVGQGTSGEHAWVGFLNGLGRWELDLAKFRSERFPIGQAYDPQTWQRITDSELEALVQGLGSASAFGPGQKLLQWAALNEGGRLYAEILRLARQAMAKDPRPWRLEADWLEESRAPAEARLRFWRQWSANFAQNPDLQVKGQMRLVAVLEELGQESEAERLRREIVARNQSKRFDLGIAIAAEPVFRHLRKQNWDEAERAFESAMRRFRTQAGGHLFYNLLQPYVVTCLQEDRLEMARNGVKHLQSSGFDVLPGTILDNDMKELARRVAGT